MGRLPGRGRNRMMSAAISRAQASSAAATEMEGIAPHIDRGARYHAPDAYSEIAALATRPPKRVCAPDIASSTGENLGRARHQLGAAGVSYASYGWR
jgi:hypothetical protein